MSSSREPGAAKHHEETVESRRRFLKGAAAGAGAAASVLAAANSARAQGANSSPAITPPKEIAEAAKTPLPKIDFPMTGSNVFARCCKEEGVAALFCCPGNYNVIHALAEEGIPV